MFEIIPGEEVGDFDIKAKFLGVDMEKPFSSKIPCKK